MELKDLTGLSWSMRYNNGSSYGCLYKSSEIINGVKYYYKCSAYYSGQGLFGDESVNEVICSRFLNLLGFNCLKYTLVYAKINLNDFEYKTYICKSRNFFRGYDSRVTLEDIHLLNRGMSVDELITNLGIQDEIRNMLICDFLVLNRDRHGANIELLEKNERYGLSPIFDNGLGLLSPYPSSFNNDVRSFDVLANHPVNNYIGTRSLYQNLSYIRKPIKVNKFVMDDKRKIFYGLNKILPKQYIEKIWQLLTYRYMFLKQRGYIYD